MLVVCMLITYQLYYSIKLKTQGLKFGQDFLVQGAVIKEIHYFINNLDVK